MSRINLQDSNVSAISKMAEGNHGAARALVDIWTKGPSIDPDNGLGGFGPILMLDTLEIYAEKIWVLFNDICDRNVARTIAVIRAAQLGYINDNLLKNACNRQDYKGRDIVLVEELYKKVKAELPEFDPENIADIPIESINP